MPGTYGDTENIWRIPINLARPGNPGWAQALTVGTTAAVAPTLSAAGMVFASTAQATSIWELPINADSGVPAKPERVPTALNAAVPFISRAGGRMAYMLERSDGRMLRVRETNGGDYELSKHATFVQLSSDGKRVLYSEIAGNNNVLRFRDITSLERPGAPAPVGGPYALPGALTADGQWCLYSNAREMMAYDLPKRTEFKYLQKTGFRIYAISVTPDGRWTSFSAASPGRSQIYAAAFRGEPVPDSAWIPITDGTTLDDKPGWSPGGNLLYFISDRDGYRCIWAQRVIPETKRPSGDPFAVYHFHRARNSMLNVGAGTNHLSVGRDRLVFVLGERTSNIWMLMDASKP